MDITDNLNLKVGYIAGKPIFREMTSNEKEWLLNLLTHRKSRLRWNAASEIGKQQISEGVGLLTAALKDRQWIVRLHAAKALGKIGDETAVECLKESLHDSCPYVQRRVIVALGKIGDENVIPILLRVVQTNERMWVYVSNALLNFMGPYAAYALIKASRENKKNLK